MFGTSVGNWIFAKLYKLVNNNCYCNNKVIITIVWFQLVMCL